MILWKLSSFDPNSSPTIIISWSAAQNLQKYVCKAYQQTKQGLLDFHSYHFIYKYTFFCTNAISYELNNVIWYKRF